MRLLGEKNLARDFELFEACLRSVSDSNNDAKNEVNKISRNILFSTDVYKKILKDESIGGRVAIATPPAKTHYKLVKEALMDKKTVFVEKPLCLKYSDGRNLLLLSKKNKVELMVGHLMLYHPAYLKMKVEYKKRERLGKQDIYILTDQSLGKLRKEEDVLWSFAPHGYFNDYQT